MRRGLACRRVSWGQERYRLSRLEQLERLKLCSVWLTRRGWRRPRLPLTTSDLHSQPRWSACLFGAR